MRGLSQWHHAAVLVCLLLQAAGGALGAARSAQQLLLAPGPLRGTLGSKAVPYVQPGCHVMFLPDRWCLPRPSPFVVGCCTPGYSCVADRSSITGSSCREVPKQLLDWSYEQRASSAGCARLLEVGAQCGGAGGDCYKHGTCDEWGPWRGFCCPNGFTCQPASSGFRRWSCQVDVQDQPPVDSEQELLLYPPRPMPADACTCRHGWNKTRIPMECPSPWASAAGTSGVPPALTLAKGGLLVKAATGEPAVLRGINWFGWSVGSFNFDGLWAYCDNNQTDSTPPCEQDGDIPPDAFPSAAIGGDAQLRLGISYWGKRRMTNDFAAVVYRIKLLGFNAVRVQFKFSDLNQDIPAPKSGEPEFFPCLLDSDEYIAAVKTMDPQLIEGLGAQWSLKNLKPYLPKYRGMQHPPPKTGNPQCDLPWSAPFVANYTGGRGPKLRLTMCNWYLPQGPGVPALYRFVWQLQYLVSQGLYVLLDFSSTREAEANMADPQLLAQNWGNLWKILTDIPMYDKLLKGRIFPDLINEPSRWGCQWQHTCPHLNGSVACAPVLQSFGLAAAAIWRSDASVPIFINGLGQDHSDKWAHCGNAFPGMHWGDGFITNKQSVAAWNISTPSDLFTTAHTTWAGPYVRIERGEPQLPRVVLAPHIYPSSVTGTVDEQQAALETITLRWDQSWGWKMQGVDTTFEGARIPPLPVVIGESGAKDSGDNARNNTDTTLYMPEDKAWLDAVAAYLRTLSERTGRQPSWFFWAWNANSGDTKGLIGPQTTWREVQWTKVRLLIRNYGLRPWFCDWWPDFCDSLEW